MNWVTCYLVRRKDYDNWMFEDDPSQVLKTIESDAKYTEETAEYTEDPEEAQEYRQEAAAILADLENMKILLPTAKPKDVIDLELHEITVIEIPLWFRDHYLDIAPDFDGWY